MSNLLCPLMDKYGSDKGPRVGNTTHHTYTEVYHELFKDMTDQSLSVFEMGLGTNNTSFLSHMGPNGRPGASLRGWKDYFKNSMIYGADIDKGILFEEDRIHTTYCDQTNPTLISSMWNSLPDMDIIIDDGLHTFEANVTLFENSIHKLKSSGIYIIEDIAGVDLFRFEQKIKDWENMHPDRIFSLRRLYGGNPHDNNMLIVTPITISVCIPTMRRFSFLKESISKYLENPYVSELVITDETGEDYEEIMSTFSHPKLRVYKNETRLGVLRNKFRAASYATSKFIAILDSDNFADIEYFKAFNKFISNKKVPFRSMFIPSRAKPCFDFTGWINIPITRNNVKYHYPKIETCLNVMNLIISKEFLSLFDINSDGFCDRVGTSDSLYFSLYSMFNMNATLFIVDGMEYEHRVHDESYWKQNHDKYESMPSELINHFIGNFFKYEINLLDWQRIFKDPRSLIIQASSMKADDAWMPFPIGMHFTYPVESPKGTLIQFGNHSQTVLCALRDTTDLSRRPTGKNRRTILKTLSSNGIYNSYINPATFYSSLPNFKFVISPEGNGIDCHRHYEALIAGCIPIIERNPLIEEKYKGCPILYTDDYSEITPAYLQEKYEEMKNKVYDFSCLFLGYYSSDLQKDIKQCGNYWMVTHTGTPVYD